MKIIRGFENENIEVSDFGEWIGKDYIDYKSEYKNNQKLIKTLLQENEELKKQLEDMTLCRDIASGHREEVQGRETILLNQQKEFIEYLTSYAELLNNKPDLIEESQKDILQEILSKYKSIIGSDINVGSIGDKDVKE